MNDTERSAVTDPRPDLNETPTAGMTARRRLVRGMFALPALATVHSGSALANSSSSLRCLTSPSYRETPGVVRKGVSENPAFWRVELGKAIKNAGTSNEEIRYYVDGNNVLAAAKALGEVAVSESFILANEYLLFVSNAVSGLPVNPEANGFKYVSTSGELAVLMFDGTGKTIVGVGQLTAVTGYAATQSCWSSFTTAL